MFNHLLSLLIWLPVVGAIPVLLAGAARPNMARWLALLVAVLTFVVSLFLLVQYNPDAGGMQLTENYLWIASWGVHYGLAVDGISVALIVMTTFVGILVIVGAWEVIQDKPHQYMAAMLMLEGLLIGVFCATDALLFYALFEAMLIPMFILIGIWGGPRRVYATLKFFIYTFFGSVFMLIALIYLYQKAGTFDHGDAGGAAADDEGADLDLLRVPDRLRDQGADGAGAHLACRTPTWRRRPAARWCWRR